MTNKELKTRLEICWGMDKKEKANLKRVFAELKRKNREIKKETEKNDGFLSGKNLNDFHLIRTDLIDLLLDLSIDNKISDNNYFYFKESVERMNW